MKHSHKWLFAAGFFMTYPEELFLMSISQNIALKRKPLRSVSRNNPHEKNEPLNMYAPINDTLRSDTPPPVTCHFLSRNYYCLH